MEDYEERARTNPGFRKRFRKYVKGGYITAMVSNVRAAGFAFVGDLPRMLAEGRKEPVQTLKKVSSLNNHALAVLSKSTPAQRKELAKRQGVTVKLLQRNAAFFDSRLSAVLER